MMKSKAPVFIVSTGRAGSTMLAHVLAQHPELTVLHEPLPHLNAEALARWRNSHPEDKIRQRLREKRASLIEQVGWNETVYVESSNYCSHLIEDLRELFEGRFIHLYRDGRDFVRSALDRAWWYPESIWDIPHVTFPPAEWLRQWARRKFLIDIGFSWIDTKLDPPEHLASRAEKVAWMWVEVNRVIMEHTAKLPSTDVMSVRLESFSPAVLKEIMRFVGAPVDAVDLDRMMQVASRKPNRTKERATAPFEEWEAYDQRRFWEIAGEMMETLGYERQRQEKTSSASVV